MTQVESGAEPIGPTQLVARRVREIRDQRGWSARALADRLAEIGFPQLNRSAIASIESGRRSFIAIDELLALAYALSVPVIDLLTFKKTGYEYGEGPPPVFITSTVSVEDPSDLAFWITGVRPLTGVDEEVYNASPAAKEIRSYRELRTDGLVRFIDALQGVVGSSAAEVIAQLATVVRSFMDDMEPDFGAGMLDVEPQRTREAIERTADRLDRTAAAIRAGRED